MKATLPDGCCAVGSEILDGGPDPERDQIWNVATEPSAFAVREGWLVLQSSWRSAECGCDFQPSKYKGKAALPDMENMERKIDRSKKCFLEARFV